MKKQANRLIALLISLVMLLSMLPVGHIPVLAEEVTDQTETPVETNASEEVLPHCICGGTATGVGDHVCNEITWSPWANGETYNDGAYYLTEDVVLSATIGFEGTLSVDLNGHDLTISTSGTKQIFSLANGAELNICDSVGGGSVTATSVATGTSGAIVNANQGGATVNLFGGTFDASGIKGSAQQGVGFNIVGSTLNLYGGTIIGTETTNHGGAVYVNLYGNNTANVSAGFFNMYGGEIYGGSSTQGSGNLFVGGNSGKDADGNAVTGSVKLLGGTIYGSAVTTGKTISIGGSVKILETQKDGTAANCGLWVKDSNTVTVLALNNDACIYLDKNTNTNAAVFGTDVTAQAYGQVRVGQYTLNTLSLDAASTAYVLSGSNLKLGTGRYGCLCSQETHIGDCNGQVLVWTPWTSTTLPAASGNYYLTADVTDGGQALPVANAVINLDLNGKSFAPAQNTGSDAGNYWRPYVLQNAGAVLNITDSVGGGKICGGVRGDAGMVVRINAAATLNLYAGTLDGSSSVETTSSTMYGTVQLNTNSNGVFNMYGGKIVGISENPTHFKDNVATDTVVSVVGSAVHATANTTFNQVGGEIEGDVYIQIKIVWSVDGVKTTQYVNKGTALTKADPVKENYTFLGWSLTENGEVLSELPVANENATYFAVFSTNMTSATVTWTNWDGTVLEVDENVPVGETPVYNGAEPTREADSEHVYVFKGWTPEISEVSGDVTYRATFQWLGTVAQVGDNYYSGFETALNAADGKTLVLLADVTTSKTMSVSAGKVITIDLNGHTISAGENFPAASTIFSVAGKLTICDSVGTGAIDASSVTAATTGGVAIIANNATGEIVLESGKIVGGTTSNFGGAVYINGGAKFTMNGGIISGGSASQKGDTLFVGGNASTVVQLLGGTVYGGIWSTGSNVCVGGSAKILQTLENGESAAYGLKVEASNTVTVLALNEDAEIYLDKTASSGNAIAVFGEGVEVKNYPQLKVGDYTVEALMGGAESVIAKTGDKLYLKKGYYGCLCGQENHIGQCEGELIHWSPLSGNTLPSATGNYYLTADITAAGQSNVAANAVVNLDLNGHTVTMAPNPGAAVEGGTYNYYRAFALNHDGAVLNITDSVGGGAIRGGVRGQGGTVINIQSDSTVNLYGGTLDGTLQTETTSTQNIYGAVAVLDGASFNVYGGYVLGLNQKVQRFNQTTNTAIENVYTTVSGSAVYVAAGGSFSISGGSVTGGLAGNGGAIYNAGSVTISGGTVVGGNAANGGTIYSTGSIEMSGGKLIGGAASEFGGVMYLNSGAKMTMTGGVISGGSAVQKGDTLFIGGNTNGSVQLLGGTIYGGVWTTGNTVSVGGSLNVLQTLENGEAAAYGLKLEASNTITVMALNEDALIYLDKVSNFRTAIAVFGEGVENKRYAQLKAGDASAALLSDKANAGVYYNNGKLFLMDAMEDCLCRQDVHTDGCDEEIILWQPWSDATALPNVGNYYLIVDVVDAKQVAVNGKLNLDLNGHSVRVGSNTASARGNSYRVFALEQDTDILNITDSSENQSGIIYAGERHDCGHVVYINGCSATFNLYGGTLSAAESVTTNGNQGTLSGIVYSNESGTFNMYGGKIIGLSGITYADPDKLADNYVEGVIVNGAAVTISGTFNMYGGVIEGGNAVLAENYAAGDGGNVYIMSGSTFNMYGGTITGGKAQYGGNVFIGARATFNKVGGTIADGTAMVYGDDVFNVNDSELRFDVVFKNEAGEILHEEKLYRGEYPTYEGVLTKDPAGASTYEHIGWNPCVNAVVDNVIYTPVFEETVHNIRVDQWNLTLKDNIDANFHVYIAEDLIATADVKITVGNGTPVSYKVSELTANTAGAYEFVAEVAAAQMTDTITLELVNNEEVLNTLTYSVEQYAEAILADEEQASYHALVKEMLNYGAKAQTYFGHNAEDLAGADVDLTGTGAANIADAQVADMVITGKEEGIAFYGASLVFRSKIAVRFYFAGDISGYTFEGATVGQKGDLSYVEFADINPQDLNEAITVTVGGISVTYGPMNYMVRMSVNGSENLKALLNALYNYHLAAEKLA